MSLGLSLGAAQAQVLKPVRVKPWPWITATLIGFLLCLALVVGGNLTGLPGPGLGDDLLLLTGMGAAVGGCQWSLLRRNLPRSWLWIPAAVGGFLPFLWLIAYPSSTLIDFVYRGALLSVLGAIETGLLLSRLVEQTNPGRD